MTSTRCVLGDIEYDEEQSRVYEEPPEAQMRRRAGTGSDFTESPTVIFFRYRGTPLNEKQASLLRGFLNEQVAAKFNGDRWRTHRRPQRTYVVSMKMDSPQGFVFTCSVRLSSLKALHRDIARLIALYNEARLDIKAEWEQMFKVNSIETTPPYRKAGGGIFQTTKALQDHKTTPVNADKVVIIDNDVDAPVDEPADTAVAVLVDPSVDTAVDDPGVMPDDPLEAARWLMYHGETEEVRRNATMELARLETSESWRDGRSF